MKFCFFGYDYTLDNALRLVEDGHELTHIFTFPCDQSFSSNQEMQAVAKQLNIPITEKTVTKDDLATLHNAGCTLFLSAGYAHKIPYTHIKGTYGINIHPALLPRVRGVMPLPFVIFNEPDAAGFTIHKLAPEFDTGDILHTCPIEMDAHTDIETLSARIALEYPDTISKIVADIDQYWEAAKPQDHTNSTTYYEPDDTFRTLDFSHSVETSLKKGRAFGRFGVLANIENKFAQRQSLAVYNFSGWTQSHDHPNATLIRSSTREIIIAVKNGYLCLKEFQAL